MDELENAFDEAATQLDDRDYAGARHSYTMILQGANKSTRARAYALRGFAWWKEHNYANAASDFDAAIELIPNVPNTLFLRGRCRAQLDDLEGALAELQTVVQLDPSASDAWREAGMINRYLGNDQNAQHAFMMAESTARSGMSQH